MDNLFKYLFYLILTTMVFSCQNRPSEILSRKKMENVMYDMYIAEAIIESGQKYILVHPNNDLGSEHIFRAYEEILPWDFIDIGVTKEYLISENEKSKEETLTHDCRDGCTNCGINKSFTGVC